MKPIHIGILIFASGSCVRAEELNLGTIWKGHDRRVTAMAFSPEASKLATADFFDPVVQFWSTDTQKRLGKLAVPVVDSPIAFGETAKIVFSSDGKFCAAAGFDFVVLWTLQFSPDGTSLAVCVENAIHCFNVADGKLLRKYSIEDNHCLAGLSFSPDSTKLFCWAGEQNDFGALIEYATGKMLRTFRAKDRLPVKFSHFLSTRQIITAGHDGKIAIWDANSGERLCEQALDEPSISYLAPVKTKTDESVVIATQQGKVYVFDSQLKRSRTMRLAPISCAAVSADGSTIAFGHGDGNNPNCKFGGIIRLMSLTTLQSHLAR